MSHHSGELPASIRDLLSETVFGATKKFPDGKINNTDEGEIIFGVTYDTKTNTVIVNFGTPISWLGMTPQQACDLGRCLISEGNRVRKTY